MELTKGKLNSFNNGNQTPAYGNEKTGLQMLSELTDMIDNIPENKPLYKDSGLWQVRSDDMEEVCFQQNVNETFHEFIKRVFDADNLYKDAFM